MVNFRTPLPLAALVELQALESAIWEIQIDDCEDIRKCVHAFEQTFSAFRCCYFLIHGGVISYFGNIIWKLPILEKCKLFNRFCCKDQILTWDILAKNGIHGPSRCFVETETRRKLWNT